MRFNNFRRLEREAAVILAFVPACPPWETLINAQLGTCTILALPNWKAVCSLFVQANAVPMKPTFAATTLQHKSIAARLAVAMLRVDSIVM